MQNQHITGSAEATQDSAWPAIASLSLGVFGLVTAEFLPPSLLTPMSRDLGVTVGVAGQAVTVTALIATIAGPAIVIGTSRFNRRSTLLGLTLLLVVSSLLSAIASNVAVLYLARLLLGVGLGGFWSMSISLAMRLASPASMGRAMAIIMTGVSLATICATPIGALISDSIGWRYAFYMSAGIGILALVAQIVTVPSLPPNGVASVSTFRDVLRRPAIRLYLWATFFIVNGHFAAFTYLRPFLEEVTGLAASSLSTTFLVLGVMGFLGNFVGGAAAQRNARVAIAISALAICGTMLLLVYSGTVQWVATVCVAVWGLAFGSYPVSAQTFLGKVAADHAESASALQTSAFGIAISVGALTGGLLVSLVGASSVLVYACLSTLVGAVLISATKAGA